MKHKGKIYALIDPYSLKVRYIGFTNRTIKQRFYSHKHEALKRMGITHKDKWFRKCVALGKEPIIVLLEENIPQELWAEKENYYINSYKELTNINPGGSGIIVNRSKSSIQRSSEAKEKRVVQLSLEGRLLNTFKSITEAEKFLNLKKSSRISAVCNRKANTASNYRWSFEEDFLNNNLPPYKSKKQIFEDRIQDHAIIVEVFDTKTNKNLGVFKTLSAFARSIGKKDVSLYVSPSTGLYLRRYKIIKI